MTERPMIPSEAVTAGAVRQSVGASLNALAAECHELAVRRGKYDEWTPLTGERQVCDEAHEWATEAMLVDTAPWQGVREAAREREIAEMGDLLATVLSIAHHRGIDVEAALVGAMQRNRERTRRGE